MLNTFNYNLNQIVAGHINAVQFICVVPFKIYAFFKEMLTLHTLWMKIFTPFIPKITEKKKETMFVLLQS